MPRLLRLLLPVLVAAIGVALFLIVVPQTAQSQRASTVERAVTLPAAAEFQLDLERLHPALARALAEVPPDSFLPVIVEWPADPSLAVRVATGPDRLVRRIQVIDALKAQAAQNSGRLQADLWTAEDGGLARDIRPFWISPVIALQARPALIAQLSLRRDVVSIRPDRQFWLPPPPSDDVRLDRLPGALPWNLEMIQVELAEQALGLNGSGVVVANLDSGVDWQHPALLSKYRGYRPGGLSIHFGNWYVATNENYLYPGDGNGHGTHTMGTMVADDGQGNRLGVAPGAQWIAVKLFTNAGFTFESWIHDAFQWVMAPEGDPALAPDVLNNSWESGSDGNEVFLADVSALRAGGILPIFAAGNMGPASGSVNSPADYAGSVAVGAVDELGTIASFSARGPSYLGKIKPEVVAPGVDVPSTFAGGGYALLDGTSMSAPHIAGVAALLLQADPALTPSQIENILKTTADPLGTNPPNNSYGWGLVNAYTAGLQVTASGLIDGRVTNAAGGPLPFPGIAAQPLAGGTVLNLTGDAAGHYSIALSPGKYDVTATAFGYYSSTVYAVEVTPGGALTLDFALAPLPLGAVFGRVTDAESGSPISTTLQVLDTPLRTHSDPSTGAYSLALPPGSWPIQVTAQSYRVGHITPTVTADQAVSVDLALAPAPSILLVDSGRWYYTSKASYFEDALERRDYFYHLWEIRNPFGSQPGSVDLPAASDLQNYDLVIWSAPLDSPGFIQASETISTYLSTGGHLLLSGQDIAFWDAGGNLFILPTYFPEYIGVRFYNDGEPDDLIGVPGSALDGLTVQLNTPDSDGQQYSPDEVVIEKPLLAEAALAWSDGMIGGATAGGCRPHRAAWLGFGLEGAGPLGVRVETLDRMISWLEQPPAAYGIAAPSFPDPIIADPGTIMTHPIQLENTGTFTDSLLIDVQGGDWPFHLSLPNGQQAQQQATVMVPACSGIAVTATITVPVGLPRDSYAAYVFGIGSQSDASVMQTFTLTAKTPAPILLLDDGRWQKFGDRYAQTLDSLRLSYDSLLMNGNSLTQPGILERYALVLWLTSNDWADPINETEERLIEDYLDQGGRLLLSTQDYLDVMGITEFGREYFGLAGFRPQVTPTVALSAPGNPLGEPFGLWDLRYPFLNWSDSLVPLPGAAPLLLDQNLGTIGVARDGGAWRTAFFSFPLETLEDQARRDLIGRALVWISPLGESHLKAPLVAAEGSRIPILLRLGSAWSETLTGVRAHLPLPVETEPVTTSLQGGWQYDPAGRVLKWEGSLASGALITLTADLDLAAGISDGTRIDLAALLFAGDGVSVTLETPIQIDIPRLALEKQAWPETIGPFQSAAYTITVQNVGVLTGTAFLTDSLPAELQLITGTLSASTGIAAARSGQVIWSAPLPPGAEANLSYSGSIEFADPIRGLLNIVHGSIGEQRWMAWKRVGVPGRAYFPVIYR